MVCMVNHTALSLMSKPNEEKFNNSATPGICLDSAEDVIKEDVKKTLEREVSSIFFFKILFLYGSECNTY